MSDKFRNKYRIPSARDLTPNPSPQERGTPDTIIQGSPKSLPSCRLPLQTKRTLAIRRDRFAKEFDQFLSHGIYSDAELLNWFVNEYHKYSNQKLDMGKSCIRFKKFDEIPYDLIGELMTKISAQQWIETYEKNLVPKSKKKKND